MERIARLAGTEVTGPRLRAVPDAPPTVAVEAAEHVWRVDAARLLADARLAAIVQHAESIVGGHAREPRLLVQAFVHTSYLHENPKFPLDSNERLEFLGDSVLHFVATTHIFGRYPSFQEGSMTDLRVALVRAESLARWAQSLDLGSYALLGRGLREEGGRTRTSILANLFEALIGAIYLDRGLDAAREFCLRFLAAGAERVLAEQSTKDYKSQLLERAQAAFEQTPVYRIAEQSGTTHQPIYRVEVLIFGHPVADGTARNKKLAGQKAAQTALTHWAEWTREGGTPPWANQT